MKSVTSYWRLATCLFVIALSAGAAAQPLAGKDFLPIRPAQPTDSGNKVEVLEFFYYGCPHCANLQQPLRAWLKKKPADVEFRRMPAIFDKGWLTLTWAYYALDAMGAVEKLHYEVFDAIHQQRIRLNDEKVLFDWVAKRGLDRQEFVRMFNSFGVKSRGARSLEMTESHGVTSTPVLTVDGKYLLAPSMFLTPGKTIDYERYFSVLDQVIAMARKERAGK